MTQHGLKGEVDSSTRVRSATADKPQKLLIVVL